MGMWPRGYYKRTSQSSARVGSPLALHATKPNVSGLSRTDREYGAQPADSRSEPVMKLEVLRPKLPCGSTFRQRALALAS